MNKLVSILIVLLLVFSSAYSADLYNIGTIIDLRRQLLSSYSDAVATYELADQVTYVYKCTWVDSSDAYHSKPMFIGDVNLADGYVRAVMSAASDCNIIYHFSYDDCNTWTSVTPANFDALSNTAVGDTIGLEAGVNDLTGFHAGFWLVVEAKAGSTALNDSEYLIWVATFKKDGTFVPGYTAPAVQRVRTRSVTNP